MSPGVRLRDEWTAPPVSLYVWASPRGKSHVRTMMYSPAAGARLPAPSEPLLVATGHVRDGRDPPWESGYCVPSDDLRFI